MNRDALGWMVLSVTALCIAVVIFVTGYEFPPWLVGVHAYMGVGLGALAMACICRSRQ